METNPPTKPDDAQRMKSANLRTALTFASFAVAFFAGIIATTTAPSLNKSVRLERRRSAFIAARPRAGSTARASAHSFARSFA